MSAAVLNESENHDALHRVLPPRGLAPWVEAFAGRSARQPRARFPVFPTGRAELIFHFGDPFLVGETGMAMRQLPPAVLLGPRASMYWQAAGPAIDWFLIQLTPLGCRRLLGLSFADLWQHDIALAELWGGRAEALHDSLKAAGSFGGRVSVATTALEAFAEPAAIDPVSRFGTLARIGRVRSVTAMAQGLGVGERRLHQRFAADFGVGPKFFLSLMRFGRQLSARHPLAAGGEPDEPEYADDSHAIREFRRFSGLTPGAYARLKQRDRLVFTGAQTLLD